MPCLGKSETIQRVGMLDLSALDEGGGAALIQGVPGWGIGPILGVGENDKAAAIYRSHRLGRFAARFEVCCTVRRPLLGEQRKTYTQFEFFRFCPKRKSAGQSFSSTRPPQRN